ncbi:armadillo-type protein [Hyaloraphidium curvatum]|nr:armadillo-type protein [Hyaloraphidium curvatum]
MPLPVRPRARGFRLLGVIFRACFDAGGGARYQQSTTSQMPKSEHRRGRRGVKKKKADRSSAGDEEAGTKTGRRKERRQTEEPEDEVVAELPAAPPQAFYGPVPSDVRQYVMNLDSLLDEQTFEDAEEQSAFVGNVFRGLSDNELRLATDVDCSVVLEKLLRLSDDFQLRVFMDRLTGRFADLFRHQYASHVVQTLITVAADVVDREVRDSNSDGPQPVTGEEGVLLPMQDLIVAMCSEIEGDVLSLVSDRYASHVIRTLLAVLVGEEPSHLSSTIRSKRSRAFAQKHTESAPSFRKRNRSVPNSFTEAARRFVAAVFGDLAEAIVSQVAFDPVTSPVFQQTLDVLAKLKPNADDPAALDSSALIQRLLGFGRDAKKDSRLDFVETMLRDSVGSHLLQKIIQLADAKTLHRLYLTYFRTRMDELSLHPLANFVVQELIASVKTAVELEMIVEETGPIWAKLLFGARPGVVVKILEACLRLQASFAETVKHLQQNFGVGSAETRKLFVRAVLELRRLDTSPDGPSLDLDAISFHGSLLVQHLLAFPAAENKDVVHWILDLSPDTLASLAKHPLGGRVIEAFILSSNVGIKLRRKLVRRFGGSFAGLAMDKYGSHVVDKLWAHVADIDDKEKIAGELLESLVALQNNHHGRFVVRNCRLESFKQQRDTWRQREIGVDRRRDMFKAILDGPGAPAGRSSDQAPVARDPVVASKAFDSTMQSLGFQTNSTAAQGKKKDKTKHKKASLHRKDSEMALFKDDELEGSGRKERVGEAVDGKRMAKKGSAGGDLDFVLAAVASSKKKRKAGEKEEGDGSAKKDKRRKFEG